MSDLVEGLADELAQRTIQAAEKFGDPNLVENVSKVVGAASQTSQEFFMTAVRVRLALRRGHGFLDKYVVDAKAKGKGDGPKVDLSERKILDAPDGE